jgi:hypothetical protein
VFNLLVRSSPWGQSRDTVDIGRIFEYTADDVAASFKGSDEKPLFDKLIRLPCLFMQEGRQDELAYVGRITNASIVGRQVSIEYTFERDLPSLLNSTIYSNKVDFDMPIDFEFGRTHWAVKDADLYRVLLRNFRRRPQRPSVFTITDHENIEPTLVSAMMPFDAGFTPVFETLKATATGVGLHCSRADDIWQNPAIIQDIVSLIDRSRVVICDCTGRNPNVFYEIGIAHTLGREVVLITQNEADIPFDVRHLRYVKYLNNGEGLQALGTKLKTRLTAIVSGD